MVKGGDVNPPRGRRPRGCALNDVPTVGLDNGADDLAPAFRGDRAPAIFQLVSGNCVNAIAFAEGWPIEPVAFIEEDFVNLGRAAGALGRAINNFDNVFGGSAGGMGNDDDWMRPPSKIARINFPGGHGSLPLRAARRMAAKAALPTARSWASAAVGRP